MLLIPAALLAWTVAVTWTGWAVAAADRGQPVRASLVDGATFAREAAARFASWLLWPLGLFDPAPVEAETEGPGQGLPPVLLVPPYWHNRSILSFLRMFLVHRGWRWVWAINTGRRGSLEMQARQLSQRVDTLLEKSRAERVDLVGHSVGGLVCAWYVRHLGGADKVRRLVTVGTPWRGTRTAGFLPGAAGREIQLGAKALDDLAATGVSTVCIYSPIDPVVVPADSAIAEGADAVQLEGAGHLETLFSARAFRAVQAALVHPASTGVP